MTNQVDTNNSRSDDGKPVLAHNARNDNTSLSNQRSMSVSRYLLAVYLTDDCTLEILVNDKGHARIREIHIARMRLIVLRALLALG